MAKQNNSLVFGFHCARIMLPFANGKLKHLSIKSEAEKGKRRSSYAERVMWVYRLSFEKASV